MKTISIDQSLFTRSYFEHICMNNIKKIYQHAGKCDAQKKFKDIIDAVILSTIEGVTYHSPNVYFLVTQQGKRCSIGQWCRTRGCRCGLNTDILFSGCYTGLYIICI